MLTLWSDALAELGEEVVVTMFLFDQRLLKQ
jgi:hypothetical protein